MTRWFLWFLDHLYLPNGSMAAAPRLGYDDVAFCGRDAS